MGDVLAVWRSHFLVECCLELGGPAATWHLFLKGIHRCHPGAWAAGSVATGQGLGGPGLLGLWPLAVHLQLLLYTVMSNEWFLWEKYARWGGEGVGAHFNIPIAHNYLLSDFTASQLSFKPFLTNELKDVIV